MAEGGIRGSAPQASLSLRRKNRGRASQRLPGETWHPQSAPRGLHRRRGDVEAQLLRTSQALQTELPRACT